MDANTIPENYDIPFSQLKSYLAEWFPLAEIREPDRSNREREDVQLVRLTDAAVMFSKSHRLDESFDDSTMVGTSEIKDRELSMVINQIIGMDIMLGNYALSQGAAESERK